MNTIKDIAEKFGESEHMIRYYCKEGLFLFLTRDTGMPLQHIRRYIELCAKGRDTLLERLQIIRDPKRIDHLTRKEQHYIDIPENGLEDDCNPIAQL